MSVEIVTKEDLTEFRQLLLEDLKSIINVKPSNHKEWLKSNEVRKLLKISPGTLQNIRINGTLTFTKIGGIFFYNYDDIQTLLEKNKTSSLLGNILSGRINKGGQI